MTIRRHGTREDAAQEAGSKGIPMTEGVVAGRGRGWWRGKLETTTKGMMYVHRVIYGGVENNNHHKV